jgi:hypothetical protein
MVKTALEPRNPSRRFQKSHQKQHPGPPDNCDDEKTRIFEYWKLALAPWLNWLQVTRIALVE